MSKIENNYQTLNNKFSVLWTGKPIFAILFEKVEDFDYLILLFYSEVWFW